MNCPVCQKSENKPYRLYQITSDILTQKYDLWKCELCQVIFTVPQPSDEVMAKLYADDKYYAYQKIWIPMPKSNSGWIKQIKAWAKRQVVDHYYSYGFKKENFRTNSLSKLMGAIIRYWCKGEMFVLKRVIPFIKNGRHLDIGCGSGQYVYWMQEQGWNSQGIEISATAVKNVQEIGLNVSQTDLLRANFPERYFDLVTAWEVLEHLPKIMENLREIKKILKPQGKFIGSVPNIESWEAKIFGRNWQPLEIPYHLYHFCPQTLKYLFNQSGLKIVKMEFTTVMHSFEASLEKLGTSCGIKKELLMAIGRLLYAFSIWAGRGSSIRFEAVSL